ncbi:MAG: hypothetical protein WCH05_03340 [Chlorobiaceae bacterium]
MHHRLIRKLFCAVVFQCIAINTLYADTPRAGLSGEFGPTILHTLYNEPGVMQESSNMSGISGSITYCGNHIIGFIDMLKVEGLAVSGKADYSSPLAGTINGINDSLIETRLLIGGKSETSRQILLTPYTGIGYRQLKDNGNGKVSSTGGYKIYNRESNYLYTPVGLDISSETTAGWTIGGTIEYDYFWRGTQNSALTEANDKTNTFSDNLKNPQNDGYGLRVSIRAVMKYAHFSLALEPFFRYWNLDNSRPCIIQVNGANRSFIEPANSSSQYGLTASLRF